MTLLVVTKYGNYISFVSPPFTWQWHSWLEWTYPSRLRQLEENCDLLFSGRDSLTFPTFVHQDLFSAGGMCLTRNLAMDVIVSEDLLKNQQVQSNNNYFWARMEEAGSYTGRRCGNGPLLITTVFVDVMWATGRSSSAPSSARNVLPIQLFSIFNYFLYE
jgi:hypothetical protein